ncbi:hypothetical protein RM437_09015 [Citrobacter werkmanii]|uniref:hypothetical protein n=1 Tax=Citrobacter werkmanii TaxID=67827 RepID=UPI00288638E4|nr:hypothetical protein [Citrobacter werkmanii]MDT0638169.1 hypothetical protein [Citrobacter werkmanii]HCR3448884.1 hypothetical protein [Citrobacter werkmanii]
MTIALNDLEFADCNVLETIKNDKSVTIKLSSAFYIPSSMFIHDIKLTISNWSIFSAYIYVSNSPFGVSDKKKLTDNTLEFFELIQEKECNNDDIVFRGFSKNSGQWMIYIFEKCEYEISVNEGRKSI